GVTVRRLEAALADSLDDTARLAQVGVPVPVWNLDTELVTNFADALLVREPLAFVEVLSEGQPMVARRRGGLRQQLTFPDLCRSSTFLVKTADIMHHGKKIGSVGL